MVAIRRDHPGQERRSRHVDFIQVNWSLLAGQAYRNFLQHGRGVVVVAESDFINKPKGILTQIRVSYINQQGEAFSKVLSAKERQWVQEYDPSRELLVGFQRTDEGFSSYRINAVTQDRTPQSIYERGQHDHDSDNPKQET